jgi:dihydroorotate dehydrogenase
MNNAYDRFVRRVLFALDAETAHDLVLRGLRAASHVDLALRALKRFQPAPNPITLFGVNFPNRIGLAAGFDKNAVALPAWAALGFGFVEAGTVTSKAQAGNPRPRIFRYTEHQALINRLGFNNEGADIIANRLRQLRESGRWPAIPIGINIGKSKITPIEQAPADYLDSFRRLRNFADYFVLNISSPNTPGLRSLQQPELLSILLRGIADENRTGKPILIKIAPDLSLAELDDIIATCGEHQVAGIVATNTTRDHSALALPKDETGGLSGAPLREMSTALVREIRARSTIPIIASGGIFDAESAREKFEAGAQLIQLYTGYIYRGPGLLREI